LYSLTLHADVQPADSGEFQIASWEFGIPHPPGYPLFTLISGVFAHAFAGLQSTRAIYVGMSLVSVLASSTALIFVASTVVNIARQQKTRWADYIPAFIAAFALASSVTFWAQATTVNIRSLTALFAAWMLWSAFRPSPSVTHFSLAFGLGVGHHISLIFIGAILGLYVLLRYLRLTQSTLLPKVRGLAMLKAIGVFLLTQLVWLYLPIRDAANARFAPGNLNTPANIIYHIRGGGFEGDMFYFAVKESSLLWDRLMLLPNLMTFQFGYWLVLLMSVTLFFALIVRSLPSTILGIAFVIHLFITLTYRAPQTVEYALPAWVIICMLLGLGMLKTPTEHILQRGVRIATLFVASICIFLNAYQNFVVFRHLAHDRNIRDSAWRTLENAAQNSIIYAPWHTATPMWTLQSIEGFRNDVTVEYVDPRGVEPYPTQFAKRVAMSAANTRYTTSFYPNEFASANLCTIPQHTIPAWEVFPCPLSSSKPSSSWLFDNRIDIISVKVDKTAVAQGGQLEAIVIWRAKGLIAVGDSLTLRIMYPDGRLGSNVDWQLDSTQRMGEVRALRVSLGIPVALPTGQQKIYIGAYRNNITFKTTDSPFVEVASIDVTEGVHGANDALLRFADQMSLMNINTWQRKGDADQQVVIDLDWKALQTLNNDYIVSVRLEGNGFYKTHDSVPALGALPTLKWLKGKQITDRHVINIGNYRGVLRGFVVVYDSTSLQPLPVVNGTPTNPAWVFRVD
jgi:hypothetical protein